RVGRNTPIPPDPGDSNINLALGKSVQASGSLNSHNPNSITDGNTISDSSDWAADVSEEPQWVVIDFQHSIRFNRLEFYSPENNAQRAYEIQYWTSTGWVNIFPAVMGNLL